MNPYAFYLLVMALLEAGHSSTLTRLYYFHNKSREVCATNYSWSQIVWPIHPVNTAAVYTHPGNKRNPPLAMGMATSWKKYICTCTSCGKTGHCCHLVSHVSANTACLLFLLDILLSDQAGQNFIASDVPLQNKFMQLD